MIEVSELQAWVATLKPYNGVAVDDGGLTLREITYAGEPTGAYIEIGGEPEPEKDSNRKSYREIASSFEL